MSTPTWKHLVVRDYLACRSPAHPGTLFRRPDPDFYSPEGRREWMQAFWMWLCPDTVDEKEAQDLYEMGFTSGCFHADSLGDEWLSVSRMSYLQEGNAWGLFFGIHKPDQERVQFPWIKLQPRMTARSLVSVDYRQWRMANGKSLPKVTSVEGVITSASATAAMEELMPGGAMGPREAEEMIGTVDVNDLFTSLASSLVGLRVVRALHHPTDLDSALARMLCFVPKAHERRNLMVFFSEAKDLVLGEWFCLVEVARNGNNIAGLASWPRADWSCPLHGKGCVLVSVIMEDGVRKLNVVSV